VNQAYLFQLVEGCFALLDASLDFFSTMGKHVAGLLVGDAMSQFPEFVGIFLALFNTRIGLFSDFHNETSF
jgi:hypothetical protein